MIFVDSSYFIAIADKRDQWHTNALKLRGEVEHEAIMISSFIISEVMTEIGGRKGGKVAYVLYHYFIDNCQIVYPDEPFFQNATQVFLKFDGTLSMTDAISIICMREHEVYRIVSFDSDFDKVERDKAGPEFMGRNL